MNLKMKISGLHCENCCNTIENKLSKIKGVSMAKVDLGENEVLINYDENKVELEKIRNAIRKAGFVPGAERHE
ncbi:MAG: heavy-metal-associated domain-containing protein [Thaumarchaeota archaeon]|nr:heavy-metal-associated domain-containing protein [Candidatus Nitrosotalea sp.]MDE1814640.1 heavy-metal-associated domain-containing protein [Nitrososphaerota archaeon]MDE1839867.1 heavy-metal-associated domain-containing protein [Nitrososphaerota archaeon]